MKIAVVLGSNIHWAPYYYRYEQMLAGKEFDLIIWNREGIQERSEGNLIEFTKSDESNNKNPLKVFKFMLFSMFVKKKLKEKKYDKVIFLGTHGCAVSFCARFLSKAYKGKFWIDVRDYQYEWFPPFYWGEKKSIAASHTTVISSEEFQSFLPEGQYTMAHNIDPYMPELQKNYAPIASKQIRLSFIGNVRYFEQNVKLLKHLGNDERFCVQFFGKGSDELAAYCRENGIKNVVFHGAFPQKETVRFYNETDVVNNVYGNEDMVLRTALSNKLYYSLALNMPILVSPGTYMEKLTKQYGVGFTFTESDSFADDFYKWYKDIKNGVIRPDYDSLWKRVQEEDVVFVERFKRFVSEK